MKLVGTDGNAFALMGAFQSQARKEGWTVDGHAVDRTLPARCRIKMLENKLKNMGVVV